MSKSKRPVTHETDWEEGEKDITFPQPHRERTIRKRLNNLLRSKDIDHLLELEDE